MSRFYLSAAIAAALCAGGAQADKNTPFGEFSDSGLSVSGSLRNGPTVTPYPAQMQAKTELGWGERSLFTIGESFGSYTPPGIPDGMFAFMINSVTARVFVNHELTATAGYPFELANGTQLTGARISYFDINTRSRAVTGAGPAIRRIVARNGATVTSSSDLDFNGLNRLCSANGVEKGAYGFSGRIFFTGEETGGGTLFALDAKRGDLWAVPAAGRAAWESVAAIEPPNADSVALIVGDDRGGAPLLLYVGHKTGDDFAGSNGLAEGDVYVWVADDASVQDPNDFRGTGMAQAGTFVRIEVYNPDLAGTPGYDALGYADQDTQDALAASAGAFAFSRPEDVSTNPANAMQVVMASTGRDSLFPVDSWGTTYKMDISYAVDAQGALVPSATLSVIYDGDDAGAGQFAGPDFGLRSPDNLTWASNGLIYVQEDRSFGGFGQTSGEEASIWEMDPETGDLTRIAQIDRAVVAPVGVSDSSPTDIGNWESSGIIDVTPLFETAPGEMLFLANTQAHSLRNGVIGGSAGLVEGGQIYLLNKWNTIEK